MASFVDFETSCTYLRLLSLIMGVILFLLAVYILFRPKPRHALDYNETSTRATQLYLQSHEDQKTHLFWMLVIFAIVVWYAGALLSSSYITDFISKKTGECSPGTQNAKSYGDYNSSIFYPPLIFVLAFLFNLMGNVTRGSTTRLLHRLSYLFLLIGVVAVIMLYRAPEICRISSVCT